MDLPQELWTDRLWVEQDKETVWQGIIALCKTDRAKAYAPRTFERLAKWPGSTDVPALNDAIKKSDVPVLKLSTGE